jgi:hypothetical protein
MRNRWNADTISSGAAKRNIKLTLFYSRLQKIPVFAAARVGGGEPAVGEVGGGLPAAALRGKEREERKPGRQQRNASRRNRAQGGADFNRNLVFDYSTKLHIVSY